ncbi:MAG: type II toxin-antitoxin system VapC family toxin [Chloroflexi bacterium]|nr:type II toxin-antitoxin system VapC family toxin [Chloroflexota bacterium]
MVTTTNAYLLDTNIASAAWDFGSPNHSVVRERLKQLASSIVYVSAITIAEVEYGLEIAPNIDVERQSKVREAMQNYTVLHVDHHTAPVYGKIRANLFRAHAPRNRRGRLSRRRVEDLVDRTTGKELGIQENDLWIVSVAVQYNLDFVTNDRMHRVIEAADYHEHTNFWN